MFVSIRRIAQKSGHLSNEFIQVNHFPLWDTTPLQRASSVDDLRGAAHVFDNSRQSFPSLSNVRWLALQPSQAGFGIHRGCSDRLLDLVSQ